LLDKRETPAKSEPNRLCANGAVGFPHPQQLLQSSDVSFVFRAIVRGSSEGCDKIREHM
jgi:hypothetical protein